MKQVLVIVLVAAAACGKSKSECRADADALTALLAQAQADTDSMFYIDDSSGLVTRTDLPQRPTSDAPIVKMNATETVYEGSRVTEDELRERLAAAVARITEDIELGRLPHGAVTDPKRIYFLIHAATPWSRVAAGVKTAGEAGLVAPMFVFAHPVTAKPPPRTAIDTELDEIKDREGVSKATTLANLMSAQIKRCPALIRVIGEIASDEGSSKNQMFVEKLGPALVACECAVNFPELRSVLWHLLVNPTSTRVVVTDPAAPKETIAFPAATTWGEANKRLTAATKGVDFVVE